VLTLGDSLQVQPSVLYIGRLPKSFIEPALRSYLMQFGDVLRLRISRNRRTGAPKHYAFVEFADADVARIVRETMDNYLVDGRLLQVREVPKEKVHPAMWVGAGQKWRKVPADRRARVQHDKVSGQPCSCGEAPLLTLTCLSAAPPAKDGRAALARGEEAARAPGEAEGGHQEGGHRVRL